MLATMTGYINPATTSVLPGYMSRAPWTPGACWTRILVHGAFCELSQQQSVDIRGRLAMMAIADMFFPHGLPGSLRRLLTSPAP